MKNTGAKDSKFSFKALSREGLCRMARKIKCLIGS